MTARLWLIALSASLVYRLFLAVSGKTLESGTFPIFFVTWVGQCGLIGVCAWALSAAARRPKVAFVAAWFLGPFLLRLAVGPLISGYNTGLFVQPESQRDSSKPFSQASRSSRIKGGSIDRLRALLRRS